LLGRAERSEPRSRVRRAEGAGLDRECADRATISLPRRTNVLRALFDLLGGFLFCRLSFHRHASSRSLKIRFDMIRGELAIGSGNRATTLYSDTLEDQNGADPHDPRAAINGIFCRFKRKVGRLEESKLSL
jgi:hypothetical protein